jgi:ribosomal protein uL23
MAETTATGSDAKTEVESLAEKTDPFSTIKFVLMTEKAVQVIEKQNKLVFIVERHADKNSIKAAVESVFEAPVSSVQTMIDQEGRKKAMVKFRNAGAAGDIAVKLGII